MAWHDIASQGKLEFASHRSESRAIPGKLALACFLGGCLQHLPRQSLCLRSRLQIMVARTSGNYNFAQSSDMPCSDNQIRLRGEGGARVSHYDETNSTEKSCRRAELQVRASFVGGRESFTAVCKRRAKANHHENFRIAERAATVSFFARRAAAI